MLAVAVVEPKLIQDLSVVTHPVLHQVDQAAAGMVEDLLARAAARNSLGGRGTPLAMMQRGGVAAAEVNGYRHAAASSGQMTFHSRKPSS